MNDDHIAAALPEPPPPAPARRGAAIDAALRRFDGADGEAASSPGRPAPAHPPWWRQLGRPQAGVLVSAALVALVGVPAVWMSIENRPAAPAPDALSGPGAPPTTSPSRAQAVARPDSPDTPPAAPAQPSEAAPAAPAAVAPPAIVLADTAVLPPMATPPPPPPATPAQDLPVAAVRRAEAAPPPAAFQNKATAARPAPPSPAPNAASESAAAQAEDRGIMVTGTRVRRETDRRGDWNICTVDDPARSLTGCRRFFDPGAKGASGRAAAHIADGLTHAWSGDDGAAVAAFDRAIATAPRNAFAYLNRGLAHRRQGDLDRAIADLDQAIRHDPRAARNYHVRGELLRARGDARRARIDAERAADIDPRYKALER